MDQIAWHEHCVLRDDVRQGTLELAEFAADLYAVRTDEGPDVYRLPDQFFDRTYPTYNLKRLVRDVLQRLAGDWWNARDSGPGGLRRWENPRPDSAAPLGRRRGGIGNASHRAGVYGIQWGGHTAPGESRPAPL